MKTEQQQRFEEIRKQREAELNAEARRRQAEREQRYEAERRAAEMREQARQQETQTLLDALHELGDEMAREYERLQREQRSMPP